MSDTLFAVLKGAISNADDTDPETSSFYSSPVPGATHNVIYTQRESLSLDDGDTRSITFAPTGSVTGWVGFMARVVGEAKLTTVGVDWSSAAITGVTVGYGTDRHPGIISLVTQNVTSFTLAGLADGTAVDYIAMILAADDDL